MMKLIHLCVLVSLFFSDVVVSIPVSQPTMAPTMCMDEAPFCVVAASYCNVSFCATCDNAGLCDFTCNICGNVPTTSPTSYPTSLPSKNPTPSPSPLPTIVPSFAPTSAPTPVPTHPPTSTPTPVPTHTPTYLPTGRPTVNPTSVPTFQPTPDCGVNAGLFEIQMFATGGTGWGDLSYELTNYTGMSRYPVIADGALPSGEVSSTDYVCLVNLCYKFEIVGSNAPSHTISWQIFTHNASSLVVEGTGASSSAIFCVLDGEIQKQPTLMPTMTQSPTAIPVPSPTQVPTIAPTGLPTLKPSPVPTHPPTPLPTASPSIYPTGSPTWVPSPAPTNVPTPRPSTSCNPGEYRTATRACEKCPVGRYLNVSYPPFPTSCIQCDFGKVAKNLGQVECVSCPAGKVALESQDSCGTCKKGQYTFNNRWTFTQHTPFFFPLPM
jgi:hypothetical protein